MLNDRTFTLIVTGWIAIALLIFPILLRIRVPYGRHSRKGWGFLIDNRLGWFVMELPSLTMFLFLVISFGDFSNLFVVVASLLWVTHYFHRVVIFPLRIRTKGKKMPVSVIASALVFNLVNGTINGYQIGITESTFRIDGLNLFFSITGIALFAIGFFINQYHDKILIGLRKKQNGYKIPYGGLFRYISCPNFFGEIVEWAGFAIFCHNISSLAFFIWTFVNLVPRALNHHKWYNQEFDDYPKERKAVIPGIL